MQQCSRFKYNDYFVQVNHTHSSAHGCIFMFLYAIVPSVFVEFYNMFGTNDAMPNIDSLFIFQAACWVLHDNKVSYCDIICSHQPRSANLYG